MMTRVVLRRFKAGSLATAMDPGMLRDTAAELLATAIFVFAAEGATLAFAASADDNKTSGQLVAVALAHALALAAAVACTVNVSGGHVNPAVTLGTLLAGRISLVRSLLYWAAQLLGSVAAALLLRLVVPTGGALPDYVLGGGVKGWHAAVLEAAMAFGLMYAYYATAMGPPTTAGVAPLAVGLLAGANVLACGAFDGAVMNPARAFGPAIVGSRGWTNHWVYWLGPMVGAGISGVVCEHLVAKPAADEEPAAAARNRSSSNTRRA